jgi:anti-anti-sigma factor
MAVTKQISDNGKTLTLSISGRFDITMYKDFGDAYKGHLDSISKCVLDMTDAEYLDSSALGMLLMLRERIGGEKADLDIINCNSGIKKIFTTANFDKLFNIE